MTCWRWRGAAQIEYARGKSDAADLLNRILQLRPKGVTAHATPAAMYRAKEECREALPHSSALELHGTVGELHPKVSLLQYLYAEALSESSSTKEATSEAIAAAESQ